MARNPNNAHANAHHLILGTSGSGKTRFLTKHAGIKACKRVILWDPEGDHWALHCKTRGEFARALVAAIESGKKFRIAYEPARVNAEEFDWWCSIVWAALDGRHKTVAIVEEVADVVGASKARDYWGQLSRKGRKYGLQIFAVSQRPQEIDKTIVSMAAYRFSGAIELEIDRRAVASLMNLRPEDLARPGEDNQPGKRLHYWWKEPGPRPPEYRHFNPK